MKKTILSVLVAAACLAASPVQAQSEWTTYRPEQSLFLLGWGLAQPIGNFKDFQSGTSISGMSMEFRSVVKTRLSTGVAFDYNRFDRTHSMETVTRPTATGVSPATLSAPTFRYADVFGIKATAHYYFADEGLRPYAGAGIGGNWSYAYLQVADLSSTDHGFTIIVTPEAGLLWEIAAGKTTIAVNAALRYNFTTSYFLGVDRAQWFSEVLGLSFSY
jgi:opacity protein-like surface antigen